MGTQADGWRGTDLLEEEGLSRWKGRAMEEAE